MIDRKKVIKVLEDCLNSSCCGRKPCPFSTAVWYGIKDALVLLREQEPVKAVRFVDLIDRQAAIEGIRNMAIALYGYDSTNLISCAIHKIQSLPSAQPEIIRCEDCRWGREVCGNIECFVDSNTPPEYHGYGWFCPNGERRTDE